MRKQCYFKFSTPSVMAHGPLVGLNMEWKGNTNCADFRQFTVIRVNSWNSRQFLDCIRVDPCPSVVKKLRSFANLFPRDAPIPDSRGDENQTTTRGEPYQKRHGQIKPRAHRARQRKSAAKIRVKCAGPRALHTFLKDQLHCLVVARERGGAMVGTNHALGRRRLRAIST
jgi:hypothetical protein